MDSDYKTDYKKYSLEQLDNWMHDAMSSAGATPQEIYDVIVGVVKENYYTYKHQTSQAYELLALLNGNGSWKVEDVLKEKEYYGGWDKGSTSNLTCDKDDPSPECKGAWNDFWEENYYPEEAKQDDGMRPWGHSDLEYMIANPTLTEDRISNFPGEQYSEEELSAMCDAAEDKEKCREYNLREAEYYDKRAKLDINYQKAVAAGSTMTADGFCIKESPLPPQKEYLGWQDMSSDQFDKMFPKRDKVTKWKLPVEVDGASGEYYFNFPDDLLEAANLKEGDQVEWIYNGNGSYTLRKIKK